MIKSDLKIFNPKISNKNKKNNNNKYQVKIGIKKVIDKNNNKISELKINSHKIEKVLEDLNYEKALIHDNRTFFRMYISFLIDSQITFSTFFTENNLYLFNIKLSFLIYTFEISFFLNSLFYTDEYISDAYYNNGVLDFISGLPKSIYSSIVSLIITNLLKMLSNNKDELKKIILEKRNNKNYRYLINVKLSKLKCKLILYFIFVFILGLFFSYYVATFCAVYRFSQKYLFTGFIESFILDFIFSIISSVIVSLLRFISIKKKVKYLYILSNIISLLL